MTCSQRKERRIYILFIAGVILVNLNYIFINYTIDVEYAVAMSYRMARGDRMFLEMWEPHQTSAFLCAALIKLWLFLTGTTTGLVLYLNVMGLLAKLGTACFLYHTLKQYCSPRTLFFVTIFFLADSPKNLIMLEHSNMQLYFSVFLFGVLFRFIQDQSKYLWLLLAAVFLCLEILAYPSCIITYFIAIGILCCMTRQKVKNILLFTGVCLLAGSSYLLYFCSRLGFDRFLFCVGQIVTGDKSHAASIFEKLNAYGLDLIHILGIYLICAVAATVIARILWILCPPKMFRQQISSPCDCDRFLFAGCRIFPVEYALDQYAF